MYAAVSEDTCGWLTIHTVLHAQARSAVEIKNLEAIMLSNVQLHSVPMSRRSKIMSSICKVFYAESKSAVEIQFGSKFAVNSNAMI